MNIDQARDKINQIIPVSRETFDRLTIYHDLLKQWQKRINLISPTTIDLIWQRHILDSVQICSVFYPNHSVVDLGSGAGFPGIISAILLAEQGEGSVDLIESNGKKCAFMRSVVRECALNSSGISVKVHNARIESALSSIEQPEIITARALAPLNELLGLTETYLSTSSLGIFPKGRDHEAEMQEAHTNWTFNCEKQDSVLEDDSVILKISQLKRR